MKLKLFFSILFLALTGCGTNQTRPDDSKSPAIEGTPKQVWVDNLSKLLPEHLCKPQSPLMRVYSGTNCLADMNKLYDKCTTEVDNVIVPDVIKTEAQANRLGQIVAECMSAHYQGGTALQIFNLIQSKANK